MQLPYFFEENIPASESFFLSEQSSKHIFQVLRLKENEEIYLTNGTGDLLTCCITLANKKRIDVRVINRTFVSRLNQKVSIAISLIKNSSRFEWFLEKATELGISEIIPLICARTEKYNVKMDRMRNIIVSAMLQSRQVWIPELHAPVKFADILKKTSYDEKLIAHCNNSNKQALNSFNTADSSPIILIGPEGDFSANEINAAIENNYIPVSLGKTRLRTETAGIVAATLLLNT
ncbi:MAG: RsmE family RNA methyltransferase [Ginsengibacter sp.]